MDVSVLEAEALRLEPSLRAQLAERLFESLAMMVDADAERLWIDEALTREQEIESGEVEAIPEDEVLRDAESRLR